MKNRRKFSIFISSTYEDLKKERQALVGVALENNFIPVGMEQFHAAPTSQWNTWLYFLLRAGLFGVLPFFFFQTKRPPAGKEQEKPERMW